MEGAGAMSIVDGGMKQERPAYKRVNRRKTVAIVLLVFIVVGAFVVGIFTMLGHSDAYKLGYARLQADTNAMSVLGQPLDAGIVIGSISTTNDSGEAHLNFAVTGSKAKGRVFIVAEKSMDRWVVRREALKLDGDDKLIDIGLIDTGDQPAGE
jgi:Cytochrome oxidase complex assembly protein 1